MFASERTECIFLILNADTFWEILTASNFFDIQIQF